MLVVIIFLRDHTQCTPAVTQSASCLQSCLSLTRMNNTSCLSLTRIWFAPRIYWRCLRITVLLMCRIQEVLRCLRIQEVKQLYEESKWSSSSLRRSHKHVLPARAERRVIRYLSLEHLQHAAIGVVCKRCAVMCFLGRRVSMQVENINGR